MKWTSLEYKRRKIFRPKCVKNDGITIWIPDGTHADLVKEIYKNRYEAEETQLLRKTILAGDRILDLGSGIGVTAILGAKLSGNPVTAVEANPDLVSAIKKNARANDVNINVVNAAVGLENGTTDFFVESRFFASSLTPSNTANKIQIDMIGIDDLLQRYKPTYLTVDVEGAEFDVLPGLDSRELRAIAVEFHDPMRRSELINAMSVKGFSCSEDLSLGAQLYFEATDTDTLPEPFKD